jgi:hypothetical protein
MFPHVIVSLQCVQDQVQWRLADDPENPVPTNFHAHWVEELVACKAITAMQASMA